ncbi:hypothetical protein J6590_098083 [Homalodisca vitripennis]|nr:hypothetical protein J6590_098083 [Homalodisca vitripennis]
MSIGSPGEQVSERRGGVPGGPGTDGPTWTTGRAGTSVRDNAGSNPVCDHCTFYQYYQPSTVSTLSLFDEILAQANGPRGRTEHGLKGNRTLLNNKINRHKEKVNQDQQDLRDQQVFLASRESQETLVDQWGNRDLRGWTGSRESEEARALLEDQDPQDLKVLSVIEDYQDFLDLQDLPVSAANGELRTLQLTVDFKPQNTFLGIVPRDSGINSHRGRLQRFYPSRQ